ncbi:hypothetical protein AIOL_000454 [Candidatus Rhodobacter oscarellae]|uniref:Uncharacterized protein n=1 Tax=Candidatus Rhodobacter oscarellae TaxID=1675527 RepID=A0A0J9ECD3_9RHOB|nr:hypothetical protein AIOL_000454 [Candidatus Rhodobacter lobularis]
MAEDFATYLAQRVQEVALSHSILTNVEECFQKGSLTLKGLHVLATKSHEGIQQYRFRFLSVSGNIQSLLRDTHSRTRTEPSAIAVDALERVVGRAYDVARVQENYFNLAEAPAVFQTCSDGILRSRDDLLFRLELLARAVTSPGAAALGEEVDPGFKYLAGLRKTQISG